MTWTRCGPLGLSFPTWIMETRLPTCSPPRTQRGGRWKPPPWTGLTCTHGPVQTVRPPSPQPSLPPQTCSSPGVGWLHLLLRPGPSCGLQHPHPASETPTQGTALRKGRASFPFVHSGKKALGSLDPERPAGVGVPGGEGLVSSGLVCTNHRGKAEARGRRTMAAPPTHGGTGVPASHPPPHKQVN